MTEDEEVSNDRSVIPITSKEPTTGLVICDGLPMEPVRLTSEQVADALEASRMGETERSTSSPNDETLRAPSEAAHEHPRALMPQRKGKDGVRLIRTGMDDRTVMGDIMIALDVYGLTFDELLAAVTEHALRRSPEFATNVRREFVCANCSTERWGEYRYNRLSVFCSGCKQHGYGVEASR